MSYRHVIELRSSDFAIVKVIGFLQKHPRMTDKKQLLTGVNHE